MEIESLNLTPQHIFDIVSELKTPENGDWKILPRKAEGVSELLCQNWRLLKMEIESAVCWANQKSNCVSELKTPENGDWKLGFYYIYP